MVARDVLLEAADIVPMTEEGGGGALSFAFSARASSSLPFSTHILSCTQGHRVMHLAPACSLEVMCG